MQKQLQSHISVYVCVCARGSAGARVVLLILHAKRMHYIILPSVASLAPPHFSTLYHKKAKFKKNGTEHKMSSFFSLQFDLKYFSLQEEFGKILSQI